MAYKQMDIIKAEDIGMRRGAYVGAMASVPGIGLLLIADSDIGQIHEVDMESRETWQVIGSPKNCLYSSMGTIRGIAALPDKMFITADNRDGIVLDLDGRYLGNFKGDIYEFGDIREIAISGDRLIGASRFSPALLVNDTSYGGFRVIREIERDVPNYREVGSQGYVTQLVAVGPDIAALCGGIVRDHGMIFMYTHEGKRTGSIDVGMHHGGMAQKDGFLFVTVDGGIDVYDPATGKKADEIRPQGVSYPTNVAFTEDSLVMSQTLYGHDRTLEFIILKDTN